MKNLINLCLLICVINFNCKSSENESQDGAEKNYKHYEDKDNSYVFLATDRCFEIMDSVYLSLPQLSAESTREEDCNWLSLYANGISNELLKHLGKKDQIFDVVAYTKKSEFEYFNFHNDECHLQSLDELPERIRNSFNKVFKCTKPNDPNTISAKKFTGSISKRHPKTGDTKHLIKINYNGDGEKIIYKIK